MRDRYSERIVEALTDPSPRESVFRVKNAVADELSALDPTARLKSTEYFNHTFAPDFVMTWADMSERHVFLRPTYDMQGMAEDLRLIEAANPLIFGLTQPTERVSELDNAIGDAHGLFTEPSALARLIESQSAQPTSRMVSNALAQGGRGVLIGEETTRLGNAVASGFEAAGELRIEPTASAVAAMGESFDPIRASRLTRVLQAVWEGSDGRIDQFPGQPDLSGTLSTAELQYLLDYVDSGDEVFWKRVGRSLTLSKLADLDVSQRKRAFNSLVGANLDVIEAGAGSLIHDKIGLTAVDRLNLYEWNIREKRVTFEGPRFFVFLGEFKDDVVKKSKGAGRGVSPATVLNRAPNLELNQVAIHAGGEAITYSAEGGRLDRERLLSIAQQWDSDTPLATSAVAQSSSGRVNIDFVRNIAWRTTNSKLLMSDLLATAVPLLHDLDAEELSDLKLALAHELDSPLMGFDFL